MAKAEANVEELVGMIERGELRLPEMQRRYVWQATRVRDLMDSLYRGYPSGAILIWETDEAVPLRDFAVVQNANPYQTAKLLLDGQQRLTSLAAVLRGQPIRAGRQKKPIELLFNMKHPDHLAVVTEVDENATDDDDAEVNDEAERGRKRPRSTPGENDVCGLQQAVGSLASLGFGFRRVQGRIGCPISQEGGYCRI